jgi:hypothetical protein
MEGRGNSIDGSHKPARYGEELLPSSEGWVSLGRTILWCWLSLGLRSVTESEAA